MSFLRKLNLLYEVGDIKNGQQEYKDWLQFTIDNISRESTVKNVQDLANYYNAYEYYYQKKYQLALEQLEIYKVATAKENNQYIILMAKILWKMGNADLSLKTLESTALDRPYVQYIYGRMLISEGREADGKVWMDKINNTFQIDDIDLALARYKIRSELTN